MIAIDQVTNGHTVDVYLESDGTPGLQPATDTKLNPQPIVAASGATFQLPALGGDGERTFYATATDTNGNKSVDSNNGTLGYDDAAYSLDTVKPTASAARTDGQKVTVTFTEALSGGRNDAGDWQILNSVTGAPMAISGVSGTGDVRVLAATGVPNGSFVIYNPQPETDRYQDEAGNGLDNFDSLTTQGLIAKVLDVVPENGEPVPVGDPHTLMISVKDDANMNVPGAFVGVRVIDGVNAQRDFDGPGGNGRGVVGSCITESNGTCEFDYESQERGLDKLQAWIDPTRLLGTPPAPEDKDADASPQVGSNSLDQDVVSAQWTFENAALKLEAGPESELEKKVFTQHVLDVNVSTIPTSNVSLPGASRRARFSVRGVNVDARAVSGPNAGDGGWLGECFTGADGACQIAYNSALDGVDRIQLWIDRNPCSDGEECGNNNVDDGEIFLAGEEQPGADNIEGNPLDDPAQDIVEVDWEGVLVADLNAEPEVSTSDIAGETTLTFKVTDRDDNVAAGGQNVEAIVVSGPNASTKLEDEGSGLPPPFGENETGCMTDENGVCTLSYTSNPHVGVDTIQAWVDLHDNGLKDSDEVSVVEPRTRTPVPTSSPRTSSRSRGPPPRPCFMRIPSRRASARTRPTN